ncbi:hypothetical protein D3C80_793980 [compost metagenome]
MRPRAVEPRRRRFGLVLPRRTVALRVAGQRLQVAGDGGQVVVTHELRGVVECLGHRAEYHRMPVAPGLEELRDLGLAPAPQPGVGVGTQARCIPAIEQGTSEERLAAVIQGLFVEGQAPRRMAAATVARALDDVGAAVPLRILPGLVGVWRGGGEQAVPHGNGPSPVQRPGNVAGKVGLLHGLHAVHEEGVQRLYIVIAELGVGRVGHGRVQPPAAGRDALAHGTVEVGQAVATDAGVAVGGDVGGVDRPQRGGHFQPAGERFAVRQAVAGHAVAEAGHVLATADQCRVSGSGLYVGKRRGRLAGDIPGQQACRDQARQRQPASGSCETVGHGASLCAQLKVWRLNGRLRTRWPVNCATALATAGATAGNGGSPMPPIFAPLSTMRTCTLAMRDGGRIGYRS